jgi:ribosomal protein L20A (L18A)
MAEEKIFLVEGELTEKGKKKPFSKKVRAKTQGFAVEKALCLFGSKNKIKRGRILVKEAKEVKENA